jgi:septal ring factor EnvC (AmiA/AmiB activator)
MHFAPALQLQQHTIIFKKIYGELQHGKRSLGGQKKRYKDSLKTSLKTFQMDPNNWEELAADRESWRSKIRSCAENHEARRLNDAQEKRAKRKNRQRSPSACQWSSWWTHEGRASSFGSGFG